MVSVQCDNKNPPVVGMKAVGGEGELGVCRRPLRRGCEITWITLVLTCAQVCADSFSGGSTHGVGLFDYPDDAWKELYDLRPQSEVMSASSSSRGRALTDSVAIFFICGVVLVALCSLFGVYRRSVPLLPVYRDPRGHWELQVAFLNGSRGEYTGSDDVVDFDAAFAWCFDHPLEEVDVGLGMVSYDPTDDDHPPLWAFTMQGYFFVWHPSFDFLVGMVAILDSMNSDAPFARPSGSAPLSYSQEQVRVLVLDADDGGGPTVEFNRLAAVVETALCVHGVFQPPPPPESGGNPQEQLNGAHGEYTGLDDLRFWGRRGADPAPRARVHALQTHVFGDRDKKWWQFWRSKPRSVEKALFDFYGDFLTYFARCLGTQLISLILFGDAFTKVITAPLTEEFGARGLSTPAPTIKAALGVTEAMGHGKWHMVAVHWYWGKMNVFRAAFWHSAWNYCAHRLAPSSSPITDRKSVV